MEPHQKHYRAKTRKHGWMDETGEMIWPADVKEREKMARSLWGIELVSGVDYWSLLAEDEIDGTHKAPWKKPGGKMRPEQERRRKIFETLNPDQREAVRELMRDSLKGQLYSFCIGLDQGGVTVLQESPNDKFDERLEIHSPHQEELYHDQVQWLEDFSIIFGKDKRYESTP